MKYESGTLIKVYVGSPTFIDGELGKIIDRDPNDGSYAVAPLEAILKEEGNIDSLLRNHVKWVKESDIEPITFTRPKKSYKSYIIGFILGAVVSTTFLYGYYTIVQN